MRILFCDSGFAPNEIDYMYAEEYDAAQRNGLERSLISFEALRKGNVEQAIKNVKVVNNEEIAIYRGWMLKPNEYQLLYQALQSKNITLINNPQAYQFCHYLPENYPVIQEFTPKTRFKKLVNPFELLDFKEELSEFGNRAIIVKDYVKSQKHYWTEACFIPKANDWEQVETVIRKFIDLQAEDLNEGLVFREYVELKKLTHHSKSGMPLTKEFRLFILDGKIIQQLKYWEEGDYQNVELQLEQFLQVIPKIKSRFFTMDIAQKENGEWIIVELGDAQVAGLPEHADKIDFYKKLFNIT